MRKSRTLEGPNESDRTKESRVYRFRIVSSTLVALLVVVAAHTAKAELPSLTPYGFVRFEAIHDQSHIAQGDWFLFARPGGSASDGQEVFTMNARHSRIGINLSNPVNAGAAVVTGKLEADFAGGFPNSTTAARQPILRIRHAWVAISTEAWELRFGQDWTLLSGPFPSTANFVVGAGLGNLWMRLPQARFTTKQLPVNVAVSLNRPMAGNIKYDELTMSDLDPVGDGERTGLPWVMARAWFKRDGLTLSVFGHVGQEKVDDLAGAPHDLSTWSGNASIEWKAGRWSAAAKGFYGENLNSFFGGILQGVVTKQNSVENVAAMGGWANLGYKFNDRWGAHLGAGIDDPDDNTLTTGMRSRNTWVFGNAVYDPFPNVRFMCELDRLETSYVDQASGDDIRLMFETIFSF